MPYLNTHAFPCEVKVLDIHKLAAPSTFARLIKFSNFVREHKINLVHIFFNDAALVAPFFCKLGGAKVISSRRDMGFWYTKGKINILRFSNLFVDKIVANCAAVRDNVSRYERFPKDKIEIIYNGHDMGRFLQPELDGFREQWNIGRNDLIIGMVGNMYQIKRPQDLLTASKIILKRFPTAKIVFVGGGELEITRVKKQAQDLGVDDNIRFVGRVDDPVPFIKHFDVCILCSESEGFSNAIIEYMGCGKATVCTDTGGNAEMIINDYNGFVVKVGDVEALAEGILCILEMPSLKEQLETNAKTSFLEGNYTVQSMVKTHTCLYDELIKGKHVHDQNPGC
jgi:glycosyltransferase involved in cell wall biosynthesis